jgi:hypothetical protein
MGRLPVLCPHCHSDQGIQAARPQRGNSVLSASIPTVLRSACRVRSATKDVPLPAKSRSGL